MKDRFHRAAGFALGLGLFTGLVGTVFRTFAHRGIEMETQGFVEQAVGETSRWLGDLIRRELAIADREIRRAESEMERLSYVGTVSLPSQFDGPDAEYDPQDQGRWVAIDVDGELVALSRWKIAAGVPKRELTAVNVRSRERPDRLRDAFGKLTPGLKEALLKVSDTGESTLLLPENRSRTGLMLVSRAHWNRDQSSSVLVSYLPRSVVQAWLKTQRLVQIAVFDSRHQALGQSHLYLPNPEASLERYEPIWKSLLDLSQKADFQKLAQYQGRLTTADGASFFGGFFRVREAGITVVAALPSADALAGAQSLESRSRMTLVVLSLLVMVLAFLSDYGLISWKMPGPARKVTSYSRWFKKREKPVESSLGPEPSLVLSASEIEDRPEPTTGEIEVEHKAGGPRRAPVTVLAVGIEGIDSLVDRCRETDVTESINDFFQYGEVLARDYSAVLVPAGGASFYLYWVSSPESLGDRALPFRAALKLRRLVAALNEARKVDGYPILEVTMGLHASSECVASIGPSQLQSYQPIGGVFGPAWGLRQLAQHAKVDLLISEHARMGHEEELIAVKVADRRLTISGGLDAVFFLNGYRDAEGRDVEVITPFCGSVEGAVGVLGEASEPSVSDRWLINNGSKIIGPLSRKEVAAALFAQEIDFDSECWREGDGRSSRIADSGLFTGSEDEDATLWVFDGQTLHGPLSEGFLSLAIPAGAIDPTVSYLCEGTTVSGWVALSTWHSSRRFAA